MKIKVTQIVIIIASLKVTIVTRCPENEKVNFDFRNRHLCLNENLVSSLTIALNFNNLFVTYLRFHRRRR